MEQGKGFQWVKSTDMLHICPDVIFSFEASQFRYGDHRHPCRWADIKKGTTSFATCNFVFQPQMLISTHVHTDTSHTNSIMQTLFSYLCKYFISI